MRSRAYRRAQRDRIKAWALRMAKFELLGSYPDRNWVAGTVASWLKRMENPQICSKRCCGNRRRHGEGDSISQRKRFEASEEI